MAERMLVFATRNPGKIEELRVLFRDSGFVVTGLDAWPGLGPIEENGVDFVENALIKARAAAEYTGFLSVADDSGLEVDALCGAPGVHSARYSREPGLEATDARNREKLLALMRHVPDERRGARFRCAAAAVAPGGRFIVREGVWEGLLARAPAGDKGFGYDSLFFDPVLGRTAAQLDREEKNACSHRGKAVRALLDAWPAFLCDAAN